VDEEVTQSSSKDPLLFRWLFGGQEVGDATTAATATTGSRTSLKWPTANESKNSAFCASSTSTLDEEEKKEKDEKSTH
jgi:hypothetical protein